LKASEPNCQQKCQRQELPSNCPTRTLRQFVRKPLNCQTALLKMKSYEAEIQTLPEKRRNVLLRRQCDRKANHPQHERS